MSEIAYQLESVPQVRNNLLQLTIGMLRNWVFNRKEPFTIADIYFDPELSKQLCLDYEMVQVIQVALLKLNCRLKKIDNSDENFLNVYDPPRVVRIDRDLLVSLL